ncbi:transcriptional regulator [Paraburkholderia sediminicola]|uniref:transcriptional regulator n=1 Tax=Paraburkholderia sediminicola TaxID=458836 RepID=UPI0038BD1DD1
MSQIGDALFSSAQQPILARIFGEPDRWFHVKELIRLTGLGSATVQRELARLEKGGLVETRRIANLKQVRAFASCPVYNEVRQIVLKTFGFAEILHDALTPLASEIKLAFVYGSVAQNRDHASSDVDLMIISDTLTYGQIMAALQPAERALARPIQVTQYTVKEFLERKQQKHHFIAEVLHHPKLMIIGTEDDIDHTR